MGVVLAVCCALPCGLTTQVSHKLLISNLNMCVLVVFGAFLGDVGDHRRHMVSNRPISAGEELSCLFRRPELTGAGLQSQLPPSPSVEEDDGEYVRF